MTTEEYIKFITDVVIQEAEFYSLKSITKDIIIAWNRAEYEGILTNITTLDKSYSNVLRIFFTSKGNDNVSKTSPHLLFSLVDSGDLIIYNILNANAEPEEIKRIQSTEGIGKKHLYDFIQNQFAGRIS